MFPLCYAQPSVLQENSDASSWTKFQAVSRIRGTNVPKFCTNHFVCHHSWDNTIGFFLNHRKGNSHTPSSLGKSPSSFVVSGFFSKKKSHVDFCELANSAGKCSAEFNDKNHSGWLAKMQQAQPLIKVLSFTPGE